MDSLWKARPPSHEALDLLLRVPEELAAAAAADNKGNDGLSLVNSSYNSTSPTAESAIRIKPAFFSNTTKRESW